MSAIVTDTFKKQLINKLMLDIRDSDNNYFIGLGKSENWNSDITPTATATKYSDLTFRNSLQSMKYTENVSYVVPRYNWSAGTIYDAYNDKQYGYGSNAYYVLTNENHVYICLERSRDNNGVPTPSIIQPTGTSSTSFTTNDRYIWKYCFTLSTTNTSRFLSSNYLPVSFIESIDSDSPATLQDQYRVQTEAIDGQIGHISIEDAGTGYTLAPEVIITGNGSGASATAVISGGGVVVIRMDSDGSGNVAHGSGYDYASVKIMDSDGNGNVAHPSGTTAKARAVLPPINGFGSNPLDDLKSTAIMINAKPDGTENGTFLVGQDFRQIGVIKNPTMGDSDGLFTGTTGSTLKTMTLSSVASNFTSDSIIQGTSSGAKAYVDQFDSDTIWFHQTLDTGFVDFDSDENVSEIVGGAGMGIIGSINNSDINPLSGDLLYIENRASIERVVGQTEDIKIVIQL